MLTATASTSASSPVRGFQRFWRALRQLILEVVGAIFAVVGLAWLNLAVRSWTRDAAHWLIEISVAVALLFFFFAITSFRRARRL